MRTARIARYPGYGALWGIWSAVACLAYMRYYLMQVQYGLEPRPWPDILIWLACFYPWIGLSPLVFQLEGRYPLQGARNIAVLAGVGVGFVAVSLAVYLGAVAGIQAVFGDQIRHPKRVQGLPGSAVAFEVFVYGAVVAAAYALRKLALLHEKEGESARLALENTKLEASLRRAELDALRMRLNPHFLFNALQNISVLVESDPGTAGRMLARLGDFLRAALRRDDQNEVTLETELGLTEAYLEVEKMRFGDRLKVLMEIAEETRQARVPTLLLQPLVENAIKHGLKTMAAGTIRVRSWREGGQLVLSVRDDGAGPSAEKLQDLEMGIGLGGASERLARLYPQQHALSIRRLAEGGAEVEVRVPFRAGQGS